MDETREATLREQIASSLTGTDEADVGVETEIPAEAEQQPTQPGTVPETAGNEDGQQPVQAAQETQQATSPVENAGAQQEAYMQQMMQIIQQQQAMIQQLTEQNRQSGQAMQQQSQLAEETINRSMEEPEPYPQFDFNAVRYLDADQQNQALMQWQQGLMERVTKDAVAQVMGQMAPIRDQYEANRRIAENDAARSAVFGDPRFQDFAGRRENIDRLIENMDVLRGMEPTQRYVIAGLMDRGLRHANAPTTEEILTLARNNPEVMKALAVQQANEIAQNNAQVPTIAASSGMAQVNATPEKRPVNMRELRSMIKKGLG